MHSLSLFPHWLGAGVAILAHVALVLGPAASLAAALLQNRAPELAAIARALAAWGPDVPTFLERWRQRRPAPAPASPAPPSRVKVALIEAANRQCAALLEVYRQDGWAALFGVPLTGDEGADDAATTAALLDVDARWTPIWSAWRALRLAESEDASTSSPGAHADVSEDEQPLAVASRALTNAQPLPVFARVRDLLLRGGEFGPRGETLRDVDPDISLIINARDLARVARVTSRSQPD